MKKDDALRLFELANLIHGVGRQLPPPSDLFPGKCTPVEITVMRFIKQNPGTSAGAASEATLLAGSNLSRVVGKLEAKGLVRREADPGDARSVRLYPTQLAKENQKRMLELWSQSLEGIVEDPATIDLINKTLQHIERELIARRNGSASRE